MKQENPCQSCFHGTCSHPANHSNRTGQGAVTTGSNRPNGEQEQVQGLASVCNPVRQRGLAEIERAVTLLTFNTHTVLTQHISLQSQ